MIFKNTNERKLNDNVTIKFETRRISSKRSMRKLTLAFIAGLYLMSSAGIVSASTDSAADTEDIVESIEESVSPVITVPEKTDIFITDVNESVIKESDVAIVEETSPVITAYQSETIESVTVKSIKDSIDVNAYEFNTGWTITNLNLRDEPSTDSEVKEVLPNNTEVVYAIYDETWGFILYDNDIAFLSLEYITNQPITYRDLDCRHENQKSYMSYKAITSKSSPQYKLQQVAYTGNYGVRMVDDRYTVALGSYYSKKIGQYFDLVLENGTVIPCVLGDQKADQHTDGRNMYTVHDGSVAEFIIDKSAVSKTTKQMGSLSYACPEWNSRIAYVRVYDKYYWQ